MRREKFGGKRIVEFYRSTACSAKPLHHNRRMLARVSAFVIWSLVAATAVFWALRFGVSAPQVPARAVAIDRAAPLRGDLARLLGAAPALAVAPEARPDAASRFRLIGVMAPKSKAAEAAAGYGLALIAVDGKPAKAFVVGSSLESDLVLQSVGLRTASLGRAKGGSTVLLEMPALPSPSTGVLPSPGSPPATGVQAPMRALSGTVPVVSTPPAPQPAPSMTPAQPVPQPQGMPPGTAATLPVNPALPAPDNFRSQ
jgi:general secretion pathway protein C